MVEEGVAWNVACAGIDHVLTEKAGEDCDIILLQLSGNANPILWRGTVDDFRDSFNADSLRQLLASKSKRTASRIFSGLCDGLRYTRAANRDNAKVLFVALTDMIDNMSGPNAQQELQEELRLLGKAGGKFALFGVPAEHLAQWQGFVDQTGVKNTVQDEKLHSPKFPSLD